MIAAEMELGDSTGSHSSSGTSSPISQISSLTSASQFLGLNPRAPVFKPGYRPPLVVCSSSYDGRKIDRDASLQSSWSGRFACDLPCCSFSPYGRPEFPYETLDEEFGDSFSFPGSLAYNSYQQETCILSPFYPQFSQLYLDGLICYRPTNVAGKFRMNLPAQMNCFMFSCKCMACRLDCRVLLHQQQVDDEFGAGLGLACVRCGPCGCPICTEMLGQWIW